MKKFVFLFGSILFVSVITGCSSALEDKSANEGVNQSAEEPETEQVLAQQSENEQVSIADGLDVVITAVEELKSLAKNEPKNVEGINEQGKELEENWDRIEKQIEEQYPEDYKNIEESLYPLIAIAQKDKPGIENMKKYIAEVEEKLAEFKDKLAE